MIFEIIVIGNEILSGHTLDTNSNWLCKQISSIGGFVRRITKVPDELTEISAVIREALSREPDFIITTGGLGPTFDDKTAQGLALALDQPLEWNNDALEIVKKRYTELYEQGLVDTPELTPPRKKMAYLPKGASVIYNRVGTAPGIIYTYKKTTVYVLPGVPAEMKTMFEESVKPQILEKFSKLVRIEKEIEVDMTDESEFAPIVERVMKEISGVYVKSHPSVYSAKEKIRVAVSAVGESKKDVEIKVDMALSLIKKYVKMYKESKSNEK